MRVSWFSWCARWLSARLRSQVVPLRLVLQYEAGEPVLAANGQSALVREPPLRTHMFASVQT